MKKIISITLTIILCMSILVGCDYDPKKDMSANLQKSKEAMALNQNKLEESQPAPKIDYSNERANLIKKATTFNNPNKLSYIYLLTKAGTVAGFYTVKGKVSNVSSYLVPDEQVLYSSVVVQAPDIDGSYGSNGAGIFFYTADNVYVEWNGEYMLVDQPLKLTQQPLLIQQDK